MKKKNKTIILLSFSVLLLVGLISFIIIRNTPKEKLKRTLKKEGYTCIQEICNKKIDDATYFINYKKATIKVEAPTYSYSFRIDSHYIKGKTEKKECIFSKENMNQITPIDETFSYDAKCRVYTNDVNNILSYFTGLMDESNVNVKDFEK